MREIKKIKSSHCIFLLYICSLLFGCESTVVNSTKPSTTSVALYAKAFPVNNGFGYTIYADTTLLIKQEFIPGQGGKNAFKTASAAMEVANMVIHKLTNQIHPPTVTQQELDSLLKN